MYNNPSTSSYQNHDDAGVAGTSGSSQRGNGNYDNSDFYEYDADANKGPKGFISNTAGRVRNIFDSLGGGGGGGADNEHSEHQYKRDCLDSLCANINQTLIVPKAFYFFFFAAFGSLFPLMAIYFKQMAMSPLQVGILLGFRPFVEFLGAPFWASVGERFKKGRIILLGSMLCWIGFTLAMGFIKPPVHSCTMLNETDVILEKSRTAGISKRDVYQGYSDDDATFSFENNEEDVFSTNNNDFILDQALLRFKRQQSENQNEKIIIKDGRQYQVVTYTKAKKNRSTTAVTKSFEIFNIKEETTTTTTATTTSTTTTTATAATTKSRKKTRPKNSTLVAKDVVNNSVNKILDKVTSDIVQDSKKNDEVKNKEVNNAVNTVVSNVNDQIKEKAVVTSTTKKAKTTTTAADDDDDDDDDDNVTTKKTTPAAPTKANLNRNDKANYFGTPPSNIDQELVKPKLKTSIVYNKKDVRRVFLVFLFLLLAGEFFCAPAITIADSCTLQYLGPSRADLYGRQRMFGSLGWAIAMFSVGLLLDQSKAFTEHPCGQAGPDERNYTVCFAIYSVLMACAFVIATQFKFSYADSEQIPLKSLKQKAKHNLNKIRDPRFQHFDRQKFTNEDEEEESEDYNVIDADKPPARPPAPVITIKPSGFVEINSSELRKQKYRKLLETCKSVKHMTFLFIVWFMGIGVGLVFTFLFWHLQDLGGSPALYGIASVINHMSELMAYFFVHQIVRKFGHVKILCAGLVGNFARFIYVALLTEPYWILPFEFIQGLTHALVWATATSYFAQSVPEDLRSTAQGILQGLHFGLGRGCGAVIGGLMVNSFGTKATFFSYGILSLIILIAFIIVSRFTHNATMSTQPEYMQNQYATDDVNVINSYSNNNTANYAPHNDSFNNNNNESASSPYSNYDNNNNDYNDYSNNNNNAYYNNNQNQNNQNSGSFAPILTPHGVPSSNQLWKNY